MICPTTDCNKREEREQSRIQREDQPLLPSPPQIFSSYLAHVTNYVHEVPFIPYTHIAFSVFWVSESFSIYVITNNLENQTILRQ